MYLRSSDLLAAMKSSSNVLGCIDFNLRSLGNSPGDSYFSLLTLGNSSSGIIMPRPLLSSSQPTDTMCAPSFFAFFQFAKLPSMKIKLIHVNLYIIMINISQPQLRMNLYKMIMRLVAWERSQKVKRNQIMSGKIRQIHFSYLKMIMLRELSWIVTITFEDHVRHFCV